MPLIAPSTYEPPARLWNGHLQTIIPSLFRRVTIPYVRERIETPDDDFLDVDWAFSANGNQLSVISNQLPVNSPGGSRSSVPVGGERPQQSTANGVSSVDNCSLPTDHCLVILSHGLEGSSTSTYLAGMVRHLTRNGFDCLAWHYRSCGGELNRQKRFYHIGDTGDLHHVVQYAIAKGYRTIYLVGFSAGGNVTLKYLGEHGPAPVPAGNRGAPMRYRSHGGIDIDPAIKKAVTFSVPLDLVGATKRLEQWDSLVYNYRFTRTLKRKVLQKAALMPGVFQTEAISKSRSVREFDSLFTAPMNGFRDVTDYYTRSSSLQFVPNITVPTLVINAKNDPFLSPECFPEAMARELPNVWMEFPAQGGHCGFASKTSGINGDAYWSEERAVAFLTS